MSASLPSSFPCILDLFIIKINWINRQNSERLNKNTTKAKPTENADRGQGEDECLQDEKLLESFLRAILFCLRWF